METRRKVVTVVFADVVGSTALGERVDPETLRWAIARWFDRMRAVVERYGGTVENYIGDAVMAVFGIPFAHEDDGLRAVRAAAEMRDAVAELADELRRERGLDLSVRIGVNTGEVVTGAGAGGGSFTAGDTVNVAARFEQSARPGEVLLGHTTFRLVRHAVDAEPVAPLAVKGKSLPLEAYRLVTVVPDAAGRPARRRVPMVGRRRERRRVLDAFHQAVADQSCQLFTVLGTAGVGKSRLVAEVVETIDGAATVAAGRCLPYGDGLTWWPLVEALRSSRLLGQVDSDAAAHVSRLLDPAGEAVAPDETFWAVRKVLESLARRRPLVLVIDDLQWAEPTFIDLVEHVAGWSRDAPLLLLIMARPDLIEIRPGWAGGNPNACSVLLEPLGATDAADLLGHLVDPSTLGKSTATRILTVADGNPLFVEELVAMIADGELPDALPPTIHALLAARLDQLPESARVVLEAAAVEGKEFDGGAVEMLVGADVGAELLALVRTDLIRPGGARDDVFRFRHQLIRDAAYDGMAKERRATLHERFADWLEEHRASVPSVDELLGHHLESAVVLRRELGAPVEGLAARASASLHRAGRRAAGREDPAAATLFERAAELAPDESRAEVLVDLAAVLDDDGEHLRAVDAAREARQLAKDDRLIAARARLVELRVNAGHVESELDIASARAVTEELIAEFESLGDDQALAGAFRFMGYLLTGRSADATGYLERAVVHAERAGALPEAALAVGFLGLIVVYGPLPVDEGIARCRALREQIAGMRCQPAQLQRFEAVLLAMRGDVDEARALHDEADRVIEDVGNRFFLASTVFTRTTLELLAGAPKPAERVARASVAAFEAMHNYNQGSTAAALLAVALVAQGRDDEALEYADLAATWAVEDDLESQVTQLSVRARVLAGRGELSAAEAAARDAVARAEGSDDPWLSGEALIALGIVLDRAGRREEAADALRQALGHYERKGNVVYAERVRALMSGQTSRTRQGA